MLAMRVVASKSVRTDTNADGSAAAAERPARATTTKSTIPAP
jgi:hypothetical protein